MILLHVIAKNQKQADEISDYLLMKKYVMDTFVVSGTMNQLRGNKTASEEQVLIMGKTRALMFDKIDKAIIKKYPKDPPIVYSLPIVNMDWDHAAEIQKSIKVSASD